MVNIATIPKSDNLLHLIGYITNSSHKVEATFIQGTLEVLKGSSKDSGAYFLASETLEIFFGLSDV